MPKGAKGRVCKGEHQGCIIQKSHGLWNLRLGEKIALPPLSCFSLVLHSDRKARSSQPCRGWVSLERELLVGLLVTSRQ